MLLRYNDKMLHLIWSKFDEEYLAVQYLKLNIDTMTTDKSKPVSLSANQAVLFQSRSIIKYIMGYLDGNGKNSSCYSIDMGKTGPNPIFMKILKRLISNDIVILRAILIIRRYFVRLCFWNPYQYTVFRIRR